MEVNEATRAAPAHAHAARRAPVALGASPPVMIMVPSRMAASPSAPIASNRLGGGGPKGIDSSAVMNVR